MRSKKIEEIHLNKSETKIRALKTKKVP